jgi:hypothetical protein
MSNVLILGRKIGPLDFLNIAVVQYQFFFLQLSKGFGSRACLSELYNFPSRKPDARLLLNLFAHPLASALFV